MALVAKDTFSLATAKVAIFSQIMLWKSYSVFDSEQLLHSMFCRIIATLAVAKENVSLATKTNYCMLTMGIGYTIDIYQVAPIDD